MTRTESVHRWLGVVIFLVTLGMYVKTMAPTVAFWDCGEFIACSYILGVPHPPGAPLYVLLGRLFSLVPWGQVAQRVTFMSALSSALAVWLVYLSTVALARRALGGHPLRALGDLRDVGTLAGGAVAALMLAFSYTQWFNATEAEVYGYSIFFTCLGLWLILYWEGLGAGSGHDRWLFLIAYLFGLGGGGLHLLCLLTIPSLMILAWFADRRLHRLLLVTLGLGVWSMVVVTVWGLNSTGYGILAASLAAVLYGLWGRDRRAAWLLGGAVVLFAVGYTTYATLYIRSGMNPAIDENDPETWAAFIKFINREQYGTDSMLLGMLSARANRAYQFWDLQMKYFFQQFPWPLLERTVMFRRATEAVPDPVSISLIPYALGLFGLVWHARRDWKRFLAVAALFVIMGFGLSLYLNMPDPQPRERHYVFGGMYLAFALWMGLGWTGLIEQLRHYRWMRPALLIGVAAAGLLLPGGTAARLYPIRNRTGDYIPYDYAYNLLQSCDPNSILFTNGDNDTFPVWFMQEVEHVRQDVRVVNLSLLNTGWYIKQLRDRQPAIDIRYTDTYIDSVLTDTQQVDILRRYWPKPKQVRVAGLQWQLKDYSGYHVLRVQDVMVLKIIEWNNWQRPIHFAITIPASNRLGLDAYTTMQGMVMTLQPQKNPPMNPDRGLQLLYHVFKLRALMDPSVHKDLNTRRLIGNYRAVVAYLADDLKRGGRGDDLVQLLEWSSAHIPFTWETYYTSALDLQDLGHADKAAVFMERGALMMLANVGKDANATYENVVMMGDILFDRYKAVQRAELVYRRVIARQPRNADALYGLAACLQSAGHQDSALQVIDAYIARYGETPRMTQARQLLQKDLQQPAAP